MTIESYLMIVAIILAPLIALQISEFLERRRSAKERRLNIFKTLMATRGRALDPRHVEALNMIDLEFSGVDAVLNEWKAYLDHLTQMPQFPDTEGKDKEKKRPDQTLYGSRMFTWNNTRENCLADLLDKMGQSLDYKFDKTHIKRSIYSPQGHIDMENEQQFIRKTIIELMTGKRNLPVETISPTLSDTYLESQKAEMAEQKLIRELLIKHYQGEIPSLVKIIK